MGKRLPDADSRRFLEDFQKVHVSRLRATGVIDPSRPVAVITFPDGKNRQIAVSHDKFPCGGGWSYFRCPTCSKRVKDLYLIDVAPKCRHCCAAMNIVHVSKYGLGRTVRLKAKDKALDHLIAKLETTKPLMFKPHPKSWGGKAQLVYGSRKLSEKVRRRMIELRLVQLANQQASDRSQKDDRIKTFQPTPETRELIDPSSIWRADTTEKVQQALDQAQIAILNGLNSENLKTRNAAAKLMLRTKQARDRGIVA